MWNSHCTVPKKDKLVQICGDYKVKVNPELQAEQYPSRSIEDILKRLAGGQRFSKIDRRQAYHQLEENITYCGHDIGSNDLHKSAEKVEAPLEAPSENDVAEV